MKLYRFLPVLGFFFLIWAGCGSPSGRVKVARINAAAPEIEAAVIQMFDQDEPPNRPFREIADLSYDGIPGEYLDAVEEFRLKARELRADAIILKDSVSYTGESYPYEHLMFRATAISFQDKGARVSR